MKSKIIKLLKNVKIHVSTFLLTARFNFSVNQKLFLAQVLSETFHMSFAVNEIMDGYTRYSLVHNIIVLLSNQFMIQFPDDVACISVRCVAISKNTK